MNFLFISHNENQFFSLLEKSARDINEALKMKSFPKLFGYESFESSHSFFTENVSNFAKSSLPRFRKIPPTQSKSQQQKSDNFSENQKPNPKKQQQKEKENEENIYFLEDYEVDLLDFLRHVCILFKKRKFLLKINI